MTRLITKQYLIKDFYNCLIYKDKVIDKIYKIWYKKYPDFKYSYNILIGDNKIIFESIISNQEEDLVKFTNKNYE